MSQIAPTETQDIIRDLGDGLILRRATAADVEPLIALNKEIFGQRAPDFVRHFLSGDWPICTMKDFTVVEDTNAGAIVSSLCLIAQTWSYDGIEFGVGQPEFVLTRPEYRRRGLIRAQMEVVHEWSEQHGDFVQVITGIPYYYRQFGYEMGLAFGGFRVGSKAYVEKLKEGEAEPFLVRPATEDDLPFITATAAYGQHRYLVSNSFSIDDWRYILSGWSDEEPMRDLLRVITTPAGESVGFLAHHSWLRGVHQIAATAYELKAGVSWLAVTPGVIRYLCAFGEELGAKSQQECATFNFWLGPAHPVYEVAPTLLSRKWDPYAFYVRVPDLPRFVHHIAPEL
ncbi:MAG TPA: GNAT family N-acetyltransferase, partial [Ktedonobacterales bacterium]|nr:GNAT family N-acetyltransferase [Ktedonobacterales bacterium]